MKNKKERIEIYSKGDFDQFASDLLFKKFKKIQLSTSKKINIALSGGNTPLPILKKIKNLELNWKQFNFFLVDERHVSIEDPLSNYGNIYKVFFKDVKAANFSIVKVGTLIETSIEAYTNNIFKHLPIVNKLPQFDLILLGMGNDGHTASLFEGTDALLENKKIVVFNKMLRSKDVDRITFTYPLILNAKEILVIVKGEEKNNIITELYSEESKGYPILKLVNEHSNLNWLRG